MAGKIHVLTGATGILGSHIAEQLVSSGERIRALVRPSSEIGFLRELGAELAAGSLSDPAFVREAVSGADTVYHCASKVGDFGTWRMFREDVIDVTRNIAAAAREANVARLLHVSSVAVYGHRPRIPPGGITEDQPLRTGWRFGEHYGCAKARAEVVVREVFPTATIVRPTWMIGPRDRHGLERLLKALRANWVKLLGSGNNFVNIVHVGDVARGAILAAQSPKAQGQAYHLCSEGEVTQREFLDALCDAEGIRRITRRAPFWLAYTAGFLGEVVARAIFLKRAAFITRYTVSRLGRPASYRIDKAKNELGWYPQLKVLDGLHETLHWMKSQSK